MENFIQIQTLSASAIYLSVLMMNMVKKNTTIVTLYCIQSLALVILLGIHSIPEQSISLILIVTLVVIIKLIVAPLMFYRFIKRGRAIFTASTYLNIPSTLLVLLILSVFAQSDVFSPFDAYLDITSLMQILLFGSILISIFLIINRKGILSQAIGILSLENCVTAVSLFLGSRLGAGLEAGILFDVLFWILVVNIFIRYIYKHYPSIDVTNLTHLQR